MQRDTDPLERQLEDLQSGSVGAPRASDRERERLESLCVLAAGVAHDYSNLLMGILGNADLAMMHLQEEHPAALYLRKLEKAALKAADLTNLMLAYCGKVRFVVETLDLSACVEEVVPTLGPGLPRYHSLFLRLDQGGAPVVRADPAQVRLALTHLTLNAAEALSGEGGRIIVSTGLMEADRAYLSQTYLDEELPEGRYAFLEVADTGCGMDAETQRHVFDPFFSTKFIGRGLGLSATLGIVRAHHGAIRVESAPGQGATFRILLPPAAEPEEGGGAAL